MPFFPKLRRPIEPLQLRKRGTRPTKTLRTTSLSYDDWTYSKSSDSIVIRFDLLVPGSILYGSKIIGLV